MLIASARILRRNWILVLGAVGIAIAGAVLFTQGVIWGLFAALFCGAFAPVLLARNAFPREKKTMITASPERIEIEGFGTIDTEDVLEAKVVPRANEAVVALALRRGRLELRMSVQDAEGVIATLGARRTQFALTIAFWKRFLASFAAIVLFNLVSSGADPRLLLPFVPASIMLALVFGAIAGFARGRLVVGADGLTTKWFVFERFIPFRNVAEVDVARGFETVVVLTNGKKLRLRTIDQPNVDEERGAEPRALQRHVLEAFHRSKQLLTSGQVKNLVEPGTRSAEQWLATLDEIARGHRGGYRAVVVSPDMLEQVAMDPSAAREARVGAAAALVRVSDEATRTRVRISAEACAEPDLRDALLAVADARDDEATVRALATLRPRSPD